MLGTLRAAYAGEYPIVERHLLYPLLLSPFAERAPEFFLHAKLLNLAFGTALLLSLAWIAWHRFGPVPALLATALYAASRSLVDASSHVNHETQVTLCALWAWYVLTGAARAGSGRTDATPAGTRAAGAFTPGGSRDVALPPTGAWIAAGLLFGLAWLTKASAALLGLGLLLAAVLHAGPRVLLSARFWALVAAGALVVSPLVARNVVTHGTVVHEGINGPLMWMDHWTQLGDADTTVTFDQYGVIRIEQDGLPTAGEFFADKSVRQLGGRAVRGLRGELVRVVPAALGPAGPVPRGPSHAVGGALFALALAGLWWRRREWATRLTIGWTVVFVGFFAWNVLFEVHRYQAPLVPLWLAYAAWALYVLLSRAWRVATVWRGAVAGVALLAAWVFGATVASGALTAPRPLVEAHPAAWRLLDWIRAEVPPGSRLVIGTHRDFFRLAWLVDRQVYFVIPPRDRTAAQVAGYLEDRDVRFLVVHPAGVRGPAGSVWGVLEPHVEHLPDGTLRDRPTLGRYDRSVTDPGSPPAFVVYEARPQAVVSAGRGRA